MATLGLIFHSVNFILIHPAERYGKTEHKSDITSHFNQAAWFKKNVNLQPSPGEAKLSLTFDTSSNRFVYSIDSIGF